MKYCCPTRKSLLFFLDGQLIGKEQEVVARHLAECLACHATADQIIEEICGGSLIQRISTANRLHLSANCAQLVERLKVISCSGPEQASPFKMETRNSKSVGDQKVVSDATIHLGDIQELGMSVREKETGELESIDRYRLVEQIGQGGFGVVYRAEQQNPIRRMVALKVIKPGMDTREIVARFKVERQSLALMNHPNIAQVFDAGTTREKRPYFVMELVEGRSITDYCDEHRMTINQRLQLLVAVCEAVQHAHHKGIVHRDLKPSNVLVTENEGKPVVKIIDFGIAKALTQSCDDNTAMTANGRIVGTPIYMSPEQIGAIGDDVDTRTDVYSLGVLLFELLTGTTPVESQRLKQLSFMEVMRIVREKEPSKPSLRLALRASNTGLASKYTSFHSRDWIRQIRGDLDSIALKALANDRDNRYETANAFAMDIQRFLDHEAIHACPPSTIYRVRKYVRRHKWLLATVAIVFLALTTGASLAIWQAGRAEEKAKLAITERQRADAKASLAEFVVDKFYTEFAEKIAGNVPGATPLKKESLLAAAEFYAQRSQENNGEADAEIKASDAQRRTAVLYAQSGNDDAAEEAFQSCLTRLMELRVPTDSERATTKQIVKCQIDYGAFLISRQHRINAEHHLRQAVQMSTPLVQKHASDNESLFLHAQAQYYYALTHRFFFSDKCAPALDAALAVLTELIQRDPTEEKYRSQIAATHLLRARLIAHPPSQAEDHLESALKTIEALSKKINRPTLLIAFFWHVLMVLLRILLLICRGFGTSEDCGLKRHLRNCGNSHSTILKTETISLN